MTPHQMKRFEIRLSADLLKAIDEWRRQQSDLPPRSEAMRRLIQAKLGAGKSEKRAKVERLKRKAKR